MERAGFERNWADLHPELLEKAQLKLFREPPLLLIPTECGSEDYRRVYSIWEQKVYPHSFRIPYSKRCCGSSFGWWAIAEKKDRSMSIILLDPFSGSSIHLPPILVLAPDYYRDLSIIEDFLHTVVLSCDPSMHPKDWVVAAIHQEYKRLAFIRSGDESWSYPSKSFRPVRDACFYRGQLYAVNSRNALIAIDVSHTEDYVTEHDGLERNSKDVWRAGDRVATKIESLIGPTHFFLSFKTVRFPNIMLRIARISRRRCIPPLHNEVFLGGKLVYVVEKNRTF